MTRKRFNILVLVFISVVINYMDRSNISIAATSMAGDLGLSPVKMGILFSAFAWTYVSLQIPGGILVDVIAPRILYTIILFFWSVVTFLQGLAGSFSSLLGFRMSIGFFETPSFPANNRIVTSWFPEKERASAIAVYTSGQFIGLAFLTPVLVAIQNFAGWRGLFFISGCLGILWAGLWYLFYRDPRSHSKVSRQELEYISHGGGLVDGFDTKTGGKRFQWKDLKYAFMYRKLWGVYLGQFCFGSVLVFFLTWFPSYLVNYRGLDFLESGFLAAIPFLAAFIGVLFSGFLSDFLVRKGFSPELARKTPVISGMLLSASIIGANYTDNTFFVIFFLAIAFFGNGLASIAWIFVSAIAPEKLLGVVGGVFNFIGGLSAVIVPIVIGFLVKGGDFKPALFYIGFMPLLGILSYVFLVGKVRRINPKDPVS